MLLFHFGIEERSLKQALFPPLKIWSVSQKASTDGGVRGAGVRKVGPADTDLEEVTVGCVPASVDANPLKTKSKVPSSHNLYQHT